MFPATLVISAGLVIAGAFAPGAAEVTRVAGGANLVLHNTAARGVAGALLLAGAFGVIRFQALAEAARRDHVPILRHAASGLVIASLGIFLFASQTLLYGAVSLSVLALASLALVPATIAAWPAWRSRDANLVRLPVGSRPVSASAVLLVLGVFLITLAFLGELFERYAPVGRQIWFQWGSPILLGLLASLWFVPGLRRRLRRALRVQQISEQYSWNHAALTDHAARGAAAGAAQQLAHWMEGNAGRPGVAIWVRREDGSAYDPWTSGSPELPPLASTNPLPRALAGDRHFLDLTEPPERLALIPTYVENIDLVEGRGFRLFAGLRSGEETFAILGVAPRTRLGDAALALGLELLTGEVSVLVWGSLIAWTDPRETPRAGDPRFFQEAAALVRRAGLAAGGRPYLPKLTSGLALAAEETASLLQSRALQASRRGAGTLSRAAEDRTVGS